MPSASPQPDTSSRRTPEEFLKHFPGHWVQYFDDGPNKDGKKAMCSSDFDATEAARKQGQGCGVFFSPNAFEGVRRAENVLRVQAVFADLDLRRIGDGVTDGEFDQRLAAALAALRAFAKPPHVVTRTRNGLQAIWRVKPLSPEEGLALFGETQDLIIDEFGADPAAKDVTRVLRLPGFLHLKEPASPFLCHIVHDSLAVPPHDLRELRDAIRRPAGSAASVDSRSISAPKKAEKWRAALGGVQEGRRNAAAASVAGWLLSGLKPELWDVAGWGGLREWNARNKPPLPEAELRAVFDSIAGKERRKERGVPDAGGARPLAERLVRLAGEGGVAFFLDQFGDAHAQVPIGPGRQVFKVRGKEFRQWLASRLWHKEGAVASQETHHAAALSLEGRTRHEGGVRPLEFRVARHEGAIWYDLADEKGRAVRVTEQGWSVEERVPVLFRRAGHQGPQSMPARGRPLSALLPLLHFARPETGTLLMAYLVSCLVPDIPHPVALVTGPQGAAKSTLCRLLRRLVDPTCLEGLSLPSRKELPQVLFKHWFASFDNVGSLTADVSDMLCRAVTGEGISRRQLFSDDEDVIFQLRRCVCLNGIHLSARPDLLDRAIHFPLERLPAERMRGEASVLAEFESMRPELLGALFDALAGAMKARPGLKLRNLPRMADFAGWGAAAAEALGMGAGAFLKHYAENIRDLHEEAVIDSPVAFALTEYMAKREDFCGTATELLKALVKALGGDGDHLASGLPRSASALTKQIHLMRVNLAETGLRVESRRTKRGRKFEITRLKEPATRDARQEKPNESDVGEGDGSPDVSPSPASPPLQAIPGVGDGGDGTSISVLPAADASM